LEKYQARYGRRGTNPFSPDYRALAGSVQTITAKVPDNTPLKKVRKMAKEAAPEGFEFIEVEKVSE
jgi:hypothetical protein